MQHLQVWGRLGLVLVFISGMSMAPVGAAQPADAVPDSASVVVRWKTPQATLDKLAQFVDAVQPGFGTAMKAGAIPALGNQISIPELTGVDVNQDFWLIVFAESGETPSVVFAITAKDTAAVEEALGDDFETFISGKIVFYSQDEEALGKVRDLVSGKGTPLWSKVDGASKKLFDSSDLSVLVNVRQLVTEFEDELDEAEPKLNALFDQIENAMPEPQRAQMAPMFEMYGDVAKAAIQCARDSTGLALGVTFTKAAIRYEGRLQVNDGTSTASFLVRQQPAALTLLNRLPANQSVYFGVKAELSELIQWSMKITSGMMKPQSDEDQARLAAAIKELSSVKVDEMAGFIDLAASSPAFRGGSVAIMTPTKRMREISHMLVKAMAKIESPTLTQTTMLEAGFDKIGGVELDRITVKQEVDAAQDPLGMMTRVQKVMFGEDGMRQVSMYQPNRVLQISGGGKSEMQSFLTTLDATPAATSPVATARKRFSEKANVIVLLDVARIISNVAKVVAKEASLPIDVAAIEAIKLDPTYLGYAITCEPTAIRSEFEVPVTQAQNIAKVVAPLIRAAQ